MNYQIKIEPSKKPERYYFTIKQGKQIVYSSKQIKFKSGRIESRTYSKYDAYMRAQIIIGRLNK